ncbi:MAG TPA: hypothetical protein VFL97_06265 [Nitrococcus sp.]|nr:hypothetical protein [Nitrococcus sp.]
MRHPHNVTSMRRNRLKTNRDYLGWLFALAIGGAAAEAIVLQALGFVSALPLAPQLSAPAPFGVFHDVRWVWTYAWSWPSVAWQLIALLVFRSLFDTLLIAAAWPHGTARRPSFATLWRRSAFYVAAAIVIMSPWATLTFAAGALSFGWFMLAAIIASILIALVMPHGIITGEWWRRIAPWRTMPYIIAAWVALMLEALAITFSPPWFTVVIAAAGGAINALLWRRIVVSVVEAGAPRYTIPVTPLAVTAIIGVFIAGGAYVYGTSRHSGNPKATANAGQLARISNIGNYSATSQPAIIFVSGFGSRYDGRPRQLLGPLASVWYYSYNGLGADGRPRPYAPEDTHQSLAKSARLLAQQVERLHEVTSHLVTVIAESEGTMVARMYFAKYANPPVDRYIQSSPLIRPSRVYYPPAGQDGFGLVAGWEIREILRLAQLENPTFSIHADLPFLRSMVDQAPLLRDQTLCPIPGVKTFMFLPLEAAMMAERGALSRIRWAALPGWHATLLSRGTVQSDIHHLLQTGKLPHRPGWAFGFQLIRGAATAWQSPALPLRFPPWRAAPGSDPAFGGYRCSSAHASG